MESIALPWPPARLKWLYLLALLTVVALGGSAVIKSHRRSQAARQELLLHWHGWLMRRFGLPGGGGPAPQASFVGTLRSHRMLRQTVQLLPPSRSNPGHALRVDALLVNELGEYWLVMFNSTIPPFRRIGPQAVALVNEPVALQINELRARRALFNDPKAYQHAFGEAPSRASLNAWRQRHPDQEPADAPA